MPQEIIAPKIYDNSEYLLVENETSNFCIRLVSDVVEHYELIDHIRNQPRFNFYIYHLGHDFNLIYHAYFQGKDEDMAESLDDFMDCDYFGSKTCMMIYLYQRCEFLLKKFLDSGTSKSDVRPYLTEFNEECLLKSKQKLEKVEMKCPGTNCGSFDRGYDPKRDLIVFTQNNSQECELL